MFACDVIFGGGEGGERCECVCVCMRDGKAKGDGWKRDTPGQKRQNNKEKHRLFPRPRLLVHFNI